MQSLLGESFGNWNRHNDTRLDGSLAFYSLLSLAPLVLVLVSIAGLVFGHRAAARAIARCPGDDRTSGCGHYQTISSRLPEVISRDSRRPGDVLRRSKLSVIGVNGVKTNRQHVSVRKRLGVTKRLSKSSLGSCYSEQAITNGCTIQLSTPQWRKANDAKA